MLLKNKKILVGITGSIAAYKTILLVRLFIKAGAEVKVVMTEASKAFVSPLVLSVLSKNKVCIEWEVENEWNNHVELGRWPDIMVIAPVSCNTMAKMANGLCDNLLMAVYLSATCPVAVVPAMDEDMWHHVTTQKNIAQLKAHGISIIECGNGELASGLFGDGRMAEPEDIFTFLIENYFRENPLRGKKVLITAGPTYEPIDPVRFIGNRSSGKMGFALAESFYLKGSEVVLVTGPTAQVTHYKGIRVEHVETAAEMFDACTALEDVDIIVMSAAVADYTPTKVADQKIKKTGEEMALNLHHTKDILKYFGTNKKQGQYIAGFALETDNEQNNAVKKLESKQLDCIVLNSLRDEGAGFGKDTNKITIINHGGVLALDTQSKVKVAENIVEYIITDLGL